MTSFSAHKSQLIRWALFSIFCLVWFYTLGARTLVPTDEGRYAEIAREMAASGDFITPRLNGIKYFGKPPLQAWMNALTFRLFGVGEWQARLWTGMCGLLGIFMVFQAGRRIYNERTGATAALVLGSTWYWAAAGHINSYDMSLSAMMAVALCALLCAHSRDAAPREQRNWMLLCWTGMGLAVMSKGLVGIVLPAAVLVLYTLISRDWSIWKRLHIGPGLPLFLIITLPWFVLMSIRNPAYPHFFFVREHFHRFSSNVHLRQEPWHYFIPFLVAGVMPWLGVLAQSLREGWRNAPAGFQANKLLLVWVVFIYVFFSISKAKLPAYILPIFPALALLIASYLERAPDKAIVIAAACFGLIGAAGLVSLTTALMSGKFMHRIEPYQAYIPWIAGAAALAFAGGMAGAWLARRQREWALIVLAAAGFLTIQMLLLGHEPYGRDKAGLAHLPAIRAELVPRMPIYAVGAYEYVLPFYLGRTMTMVAHAEDGMQPGLQQEPYLWIPELDTFVKAWKAHRANGTKAMAFMRPDIHARLQKLGVPMRVIAQDERRVVVVNEVKE